MPELEELVLLEDVELEDLLELLEVVLEDVEPDVLLEEPCVDQYAEVSLLELLGLLVVVEALGLGAALVTASTPEPPKEPPPPPWDVPLELV